VRSTNTASAPAAWQTQSMLLAYPDEDLPARADLARRVAATLPEPVGSPLIRHLEHIDRTPLGELAADYVATFDNRKRCCLYLTYYAHGDTRKRGIALLAMKQTYQAAGLVLGDDELPDHLAVVLEFAAAEPDAGRRLLLQHRAGVELLRLTLRDATSPWALVLDSVSATLPSLVGDERQAIARLAVEGPPEEQVGLAPFGSPVLLPDPVIRGAR
jgi:nitrate reductase delta subunit